MANYTVNISKHATLEAETADLVTLTGNASTITVFAHGGESSGDIYFTVGDNPETAVAEANNTFVAFVGDSYTVKFDGTNAKVSLVSDSATPYSVIAQA